MGRRTDWATRYHLTEYEPPADAVACAHERVADLVAHFIVTGSGYDKLMSLARSCYLQGVQDAAVSALLMDTKKS